MSVYLGQDKVGVSYLTTANMYEDNRTIMWNTIFTPWTRPEEWPDLDSLNLEMNGTESFIYMTFRTGHVDDVCSFNFTTVSGTITIELGTISNGTFISTFSETANSGSGVSKTYWFTSNEGYSEGTIVVKITGRLARFYLTDISRPLSDGGGTIKYYMQPMLERIWYIPELTCFYNGSSTSTTGNGTYTIERDKVGNDSGTVLTSLTSAWYQCYRLQSLDISQLHTQNVTTMSSMFSNCKILETLDVSTLNTAKVTNMNSMFYWCNRLKQLDLRNWNTEKLTGGGFTSAFYCCYALKEILGLENIYTNNLTDLANVFYYCYSLKDLSGITNWNIGKVTNVNNIFCYCFGIKTLDLSHWDVSKVTKMSGMFYGCRNVEHILFPQTQTSTITAGLGSLFNACYNLQEVDVTWIKPITSSVTTIAYMFSNCRSLKEINIPEGWDITGCVSSESTMRVFSDCYKLERITGISNWDMSNYNYSLAYLFQYDFCLKSIDIKNWRPHPTSMYYAFQNCESLEEIDLSGWNWENMTGTGVQNMFSSCYSLKTIKGIEHMGDSGNLTTFANVFGYCYSLTSISNINSWNPANVTSCASMFNSCMTLQSVTISNWSLPKCTNISNMFRYCYHMKELELTGWSLPALTTAPDYIFCQMYCLQKCSGLPINLNHRYQEDYSLPEDQWARIFTQLPTVSGKTLYMTTANINKLSSTTKAIATNKGWTLSN